MRRLAAVVGIMLMSAVLPGSVGATHEGPLAKAAILFSSDGMRPDFVERFAREGALPVMADLLRRGVRGDNGLLPALPPNTGVGWTTLATGAWTGVHGSTNNTFHQTGTDFTRSMSAFAPGVIQAETIAQAAERAGKRVVAVEWAASRNYPIRGPAVDFRTFFSRRGVISTFDPPGLNEEFVREFGLVYNRITLSEASGWTNVPDSERPAREATLVIPTTNAAVNPTRTYFLYIFDSTPDGHENYDRVLVAPSRDGSTAVATLKRGKFVEVKVRLTDGRTAGFYLKVIDLEPNLSKFRLTFTSVARVSANTPTLEEELASSFPTSQGADFGPLEAGIVDEETYVEQGLLWESAHWPILKHLVDTHKPDLLLLGDPLTDEFQHQFLALVTPGTPVFDDADRDGKPDGRVHERLGFLRRAHESADRTLGLAMKLMPRDTAVFVSSDHGFAATWKAVNASVVLQGAGLVHQPQPGNCRPASAQEKTKACWTGGSVQVYVNLRGRDVPGVVDPAEFEATRQGIIKAFARLRDGRTRVADRIFLKEDLVRLRVGGTIQTVAHATRTGDVVVLLRPPYQFDGASPGKAIADQPFFGQHGFWPDLVNLQRGVNMHSTFIMAGPGIRSNKVLRRVNMVDVVPTLAAVLGIPAPANSQGRVLRRGFINP